MQGWAHGLLQDWGPELVKGWAYDPELVPDCLCWLEVDRPVGNPYQELDFGLVYEMVMIPA